MASEGFVDRGALSIEDGSKRCHTPRCGHFSRDTKAWIGDARGPKMTYVAWFDVVLVLVVHLACFTALYFPHVSRCLKARIPFVNPPNFGRSCMPRFVFHLFLSFFLSSSPRLSLLTFRPFFSPITVDGCVERIPLFLLLFPWILRVFVP